MISFISRYLCVMAAFLAVLTAHSQVTLTEEGAMKAVIVANEHAAQATILADYLGRMAGAEVPVVADEAAIPAGSAALVLRLADAIAGLDDTAAGMQGYRLHTEANRLHLTARSAQGLTYAVYGFLEDHLGVRYYSPDFEIVPTRATIQLAQIDDLQQPAFRLRSMGGSFIRGEYEWREKNRASGNTRIVSGHNFYTWIPPKTYFADHPEWFALIGGKRSTPHTMALCATNPELAEEMARNIMVKMADHDPATPIPAGQGDGFTPCECPDCRALVKEQSSEIAPYIQLLNRVLERTADQYPEHQLVTFAYFGTLKAPLTLRPHHNLWVNVVSSSLPLYPAGDQLGRIRDNIHNRDYREAIITWGKLVPGRLAMWDWTCNFTDATVEWPNILNVCDNVRFFHEQGAETVLLEMPAGELNWVWMRKWLFSKMLWNPSQDPEALRRQFVDDYYGAAAAPFIHQYLRYVEQVARESRYASATVRWTCFTSILRQKLFTDDKLEAMSTLMQAALEAARTEADPAFAGRVEKAMATSIDSLLLTDAGALTRVVNPRDNSLWLVPGGRPDFPERIERTAAAHMLARGAGAEPWHFRYRFLLRTGGKIETASSDSLVLELLPAIRGQLLSLVHRPTMREMLAPGEDFQTGGYTDLIPGVSTVGWEEVQTLPNGVAMTATAVSSPWSTPAGIAARKQRYHLHRSVSVQDATITVQRHYDGQKMRDAQQSFVGRWSLAMPHPERSRLTVKGGGIDRTFDLHHVAASTPGGDAVPELSAGDVDVEIFTVIEGKAIELPIVDQEGDLTIQLDRGDGLLALLSTSAAGHQSIALTPQALEGRLSISLTSIPHTLGDSAARIDLPAMTLRIDSTAAAVEPPRLSVNPVDKAELVYIPHGTFTMGSPAGEGLVDESPSRRIELDGYWIYRHPVTVAQYRTFCEATGRTMPSLPPASAGDNHPIFNVDWHDANAYAVWAGAALPTEAQWEKAARGVDARRYPWGNDWDGSRCASLETTVYRQEYGTHPVDAHPDGASPYGVMDMAGNVWEWVADWYAHDAYRGMLANNPTGPERGSHKVLRGGSINWNEQFQRVTQRMINPPDARGWIYAGFRCALPRDAVKE